MEAFTTKKATHSECIAFKVVVPLGLEPRTY